MDKYLLKISGAGNRFLLVDEKWFNQAPPVEWLEYSCKTKRTYEDFLNISTMSLLERKKFIKSITESKIFSLTDGLVVLKKSTKFVFVCDFYNKDGSKAEMCGNAACCISSYIKWMSYPLGAFCLGEEIISCVPQGGIALNNVLVPIANCTYNFKGYPINFTLIDSGVPHGVIEFPLNQQHISKDLFKDLPVLKELAKDLRYKNPKNSQGMNVSFFQVKKANKLQAVTFERGVEDFTLSCGTGALAVVFVYRMKSKIEDLNIIFVKMPGGELKVQLQPLISLFSPVKKGY